MHESKVERAQSTSLNPTPLPILPKPFKHLMPNILKGNKNNKNII